MSEAKGPQIQQPQTEEMLMEVIRNLRAHPEQYQRLRKAMQEATDRARVQTLLQFVTTDRDLAALMPARGGGGMPGGEAALAWTTVTVTTVFILEGSAY
jgi:hypothetical protein